MVPSGLTEERLRKVTPVLQSCGQGWGQHPKTAKAEAVPTLMAKGTKSRVLPKLTNAAAAMDVGCPARGGRRKEKGGKEEAPLEGPQPSREGASGGQGEAWGKYLYFPFLLLSDVLPEPPTGRTQLEAEGGAAADAVRTAGQRRARNENNQHTHAQPPRGLEAPGCLLPFSSPSSHPAPRLRMLPALPLTTPLPPSSSLLH